MNSGKTLTIASGGSFTHSGTSATISGNLSNSGTVTVNSGKTMTIGSGGTFTHSGTAATINGTLTNNGTLAVNSGKTLAVASGGTFIHNGSQDIIAGILDNNGTVTVPTGETLNVGGNFIHNGTNATINGVFGNYGTVTVNSGKTMTIGTGGNFTHNGTAVTVNGTLANNGTFYLNTGTNVSISGTLTNNGTVTVNSGKTLTIASGGTFTHVNALTVTGTLTNHGTFMGNSAISVNGSAGLFDNYGTMTVGSGTTMAMTSGGSFAQSGGTATISGSMTKNGTSGSVTVASGATLTVASGGSFTYTGAAPCAINGNLTNNGTVTLSTSWTITVASGGMLTNNGTFIRNGIFNNNGTVNGTGSFSGNISNSATGTYAPGSSPGCLIFNNNYTHSGGTLSIEVNGTTACSGHDVMDIGGTATLSGTLSISIGYTPSSGDLITFIDAAAISGTFTSINPPLPSGWALAYNSPSAGKVSISYALLPVELTSFRAVLQDDRSVLLDWETASETNNEGFEVERSGDGIQWSLLGFVDGHGSTLEAQAYNFVDALPLAGTNYYRLRQVDFDGGHEYSKTVSVEVEVTKGRLVLFPNPASTEVNLRFSQAYEKGEVAVFDAMGKLVLQRSLEGGDEVMKLDAKGLAKGVYTVLFQADGQAVFEKLAID